MSFIVVCIDKEDPAKSEIVPADLDCMLFPTKENALRWTKADERELPGVYDYHIIQVG